MSTQHSIPGLPEPPNHGRPDFTSYGAPEPRRSGIGVDVRNFLILVMIGAIIFGVVRQCHSTPPEQKPLSPSEQEPLSPSQEKPSAPSQEKPSSPETPHPQRTASCRTAAERMDKNGALPRDYSINCPYWQWWTHNAAPPRPQTPPDSPRTRVLPESEPSRPQVLLDPDPPRHERDALRIWRDRRDRAWCFCRF